MESPQPSSFSTRKHIAEHVEKPWAPKDRIISTGTSKLPSVGRRHRELARSLSEGRTEVLQSYLNSQLTHLSGDAAEKFEASILGISDRESLQESTTKGSPTRRKQRSPYRKSRGPILYPDRGSSIPIGTHAEAGENTRGPKTLADTMTAAEAAASLQRSMQLGDRSVAVPSIARERSLARKSSGSPMPAPASPVPQLHDRWPARTSGQQHDDLAALSYHPFSPDQRAITQQIPKVLPPPPLVVDDGILFQDKSVVAGIASRPRARASEETRSAATSPVKLRTSSVSPARSALSSQLTRSVPKLLDDLEHYLLSELERNNVGGADMVANPLRAQIVGECFDCYISHCSTYAPLLSKIKAEYEERNVILAREFEKVRPALSRLATLEATTAEEKANQHVSHFHETQQLVKENEEMKREKWALEKLVREQAEQLEENRKAMDKYQDESETDYNQIAALGSALQHYKKLGQESEVLWQEKENLSRQLKEVEMERDLLSIQMDGVIASDVYDALKQQFEKLQEKLRTVEKEGEDMGRKLLALQGANTRLKEKLQTLNTELNDLRRSGTPRPNSDPIFEVLGTTREEALEVGPDDRASTVATFEYLLTQTVKLEQRIRHLESLAPNDDPYFIGLGLGEEVIPSLRVPKGTRIRNRRMVKRDIEHFVDKMFKRKQVDDRHRAAKHEPTLQFVEFFHQELVRQQIHQNRVAEVAYNVLDACKRYSYDADIELFSKVMRGDCSEAVLKQQMKMLRDIRKGIEALTVMEENGKTVKVPGAPTKDQILQLCRGYPMLANLHDKCFEQLKDKLDTDSPDDGRVDWKKLFVRTIHCPALHSSCNGSSLLADGRPFADGTCIAALIPTILFFVDVSQEEDQDGNQYAFVECLRDLVLSDRDQYFDELEEAICEQDLESDGLVNAVRKDPLLPSLLIVCDEKHLLWPLQEELRAAVRKIDPNKSPEAADALIRLGLMLEKHEDVVTEELDEDGKALLRCFWGPNLALAER